MQYASLLLPWAAVTVLATLAVSASESAIESDSTFRALWLAVGLVWAFPFFFLFAQWVAAETPWAFGPPVRSRYGKSSLAFTAYLSLFTGGGLIYAFSTASRNKK